MFQFKRQMPAPDSEDITLEVYTEPARLVERLKVLGVTVGIAYLCLQMVAVKISARSGLNSAPTRLPEACLG